MTLSSRNDSSKPNSTSYSSRVIGFNAFVVSVAHERSGKREESDRHQGRSFRDWRRARDVVARGFNPCDRGASARRPSDGLRARAMGWVQVTAGIAPKPRALIERRRPGGATLAG